jgi:hypothetical protein
MKIEIIKNFECPIEHLFEKEKYVVGKVVWSNGEEAIALKKKEKEKSQQNWNPPTVNAPSTTGGNIN